MDDPSADDPGAPDEVAVNGLVGDVLVRLVDGWRPELPSLASVRTMTWGTHTLPSITDVDLSHENLRIRCTGPFDNALKSASGAPLEGLFADGVQLSAEQAFWTTSQGPHTWLEGAYWTLTDPIRRPTLWVAPLAGSLPQFGANLVIRRSPDEGSGGHFCLRGAYNYFIVRHGHHCFLVVETADREPPARKVLFRDFLALQFVLGRVLTMDKLLGVDQSGQTTSVLGGRFGRHAGRNAQFEAPVPMWVGDEAWAPVFFSGTLRYLPRAPRAPTSHPPIGVR